MVFWSFRCVPVSFRSVHVRCPHGVAVPHFGNGVTASGDGRERTNRNGMATATARRPYRAPSSTKPLNRKLL